jgi:bacterioferritin-associated ferredoxin
MIGDYTRSRPSGGGKAAFSVMLLTIILITINVSIQITVRKRSTMYVCLCKGITDTQIRTAVEDGANSLRDVRNALGVASQCGKCGILTREIVRETLLSNTDEQQLFYAVS